jgi:2-polyprenyl-6-methoxyphenol hydroxylase-like FAD-dependent oxidoreductase
MESAQHSPLDVLIVGAGPTGLALAAHCLRQGLRIRLVDKQPHPSTTSKAIGLQYRVSEILACMGVVDRFIEQGGSPTTVNMYAGGKRLLSLDFRGFGVKGGKDAFAPRAIMIPQSQTESLLGDLVRERGGQVEWDTEFVDFSQDAEQVVSRLRHSEGGETQVVSKYLVSCEGAHSQIRKQAGLSFAGKTYPLAFFMADVEIDWPLDHDENHVWFHADGSFAALPLPRPHTWRLFVEVSRQIDRLPKDLTLDLIREIMAERSGDRQTRLTNPTWISEFRVNCRMVDRYRSGRVFVAGDAAHIHSPTGGQGIATGLQDATNLAWKLGRVLRGAPDSLLDTYQEERLPHAREVLTETDRTTTIFFAPTRLMRLLRDFVVLPILKSRIVQNRLFAKLSQLHVNYRRSSLSRHDDARWWFSPTRIRAGDRAPDVAFRHAGSGQMTTLFELLREMRPVALVGLDPTSHKDTATRVFDLLQANDVAAFQLVPPGYGDGKLMLPCLSDAYGDFHRIYGITGEFVCLIRPDGHVGLFQRPFREASLKGYLRNICRD